MKIGDTVFQNYAGIHRYGKLKEIKDNFLGDKWSWFKVNWINDDAYETAQKWKADMRGLEENAYLPEYYRADDIQKIDLNKTVETLLKLQNK